jgi:CRP-like cAMP-binding protein
MSHLFNSQANSQSNWRQLLEDVYQGRSLYPFRGGQNIPMYSHEIWVVCRGIVQLSTLHPNGDEVSLGLVGSSMPFGLPLTFLNPYQAIALSDVDLMRFTMVEVEASPQLMQGIFRHLSLRLQRTEAMLALVSHRRVEDRLRQLLLLLKDEIGQPVVMGTRLSVRLTHQHLANAIGSTRVTVTRALGHFQAENLLKIDRDRHILLMNDFTGV